jgi:amidase
VGNPFPEFASAFEAAEAIRRGAISAVELTELTLERIDRFNAALNAIVNVLRDKAMEAARAADAALAKGQRLGPLLGVPVTIKDSFEIAGVRTTAGAPFLKDHIPAADSAAVARLRRAGAVILGNTNVPFMLGDWQSYNEIYGTTNNPWDLARTPGGSSGGTAAALAAGLGFLSIGSDLAGSIRVPAHFCGIYGHKPTLNVVPLRGHIPPPPGVPPQPPTDLPVGGPMARSAGDLKLAMEVLGGPDGDDAVAYDWRLPPARGCLLADYRAGFVLDHPRCPVSTEIKEVLVDAVNALRKAGLRLEEGWPAGVDPDKQYETHRYLHSAFFALHLDDDNIEEVRARAARSDGGVDALQARAWIDPHKYFQAASSDRMVARAAWQRYFRSHDVFLMPTAFVSAFPHDHSDPTSARRLATPDGPRQYMDLPFWISFATLGGLPATTAPVGLTGSGLPVGIQILGPYLEDATPIDVAGKMADVIGGFRPPKGL